MKIILLSFLLFCAVSEAQISVLKFGPQNIYSTQGSIVCSYSSSSNFGIKFNFDKGRAVGIERALVSRIRYNIEQSPHHLATVKTNLVSSDIFDYEISGEVSGVHYKISMNRSTKIGTGSHFKGSGMTGLELVCKFTK